MFLIELNLLFLIIVANGAPIITRYFLKDYGDWPVDGGRCCLDGQRWLGDSKTWRGIIASCVVTVTFALALALPSHIGLLIAVGAMAGDVLSSFIKRRLKMASSSMALGIDQVPEALLPLLVVQPIFQLSGVDIVALTVAFIVLELVLSRILFRMGIREQPY